jgi:hypothetical protein
MTDELENIWKEEVVAYFESLWRDPGVRRD